jgi:hypothetical protein
LNQRLVIAALLVGAHLVLFSACSRGSQDSTNSAQANKPPENVPTAFHQTVQGNVDRARLSVESARDLIQQSKWQEALAELQKVKKEVEAGANASSGENAPPFIRSSLEDMKGAVDRTIESATGRRKETEAQITDLHTRLMALKSQMR